MLNKNWLFLFALILLIPSVMASEGGMHSFGPSIHYETMSMFWLSITAVSLLVAMIVFTVLLEHSIEIVASKTGTSIGTALLACASSLPLLVFSVIFALQGLTTTALVNIVGTNIANVTVVLGILALIKPLTIEENFKKGITAVIITILILILMLVNISFDGGASILPQNYGFELIFWEGIIIFVLFGLFIALMQLFSKKEKNNSTKEHNLLFGVFGSIIFGLIVCWTAAQAVSVLIHIAQIYHLPEIIVGTVLVIIGTSFPEFAVGIVSIGMKKDKDVYGNLISSVMVNICLGIGIIVLLTRNLVIDASLMAYQIPFMILALLLSVYLIQPRFKHLNRKHAFILIGTYVLFLIGLQLHFVFF
jgi:cation:H+ antiporter